MAAGPADHPKIVQGAGIGHRKPIRAGGAAPGKSLSALQFGRAARV
jgi:hypothetical protein